VSERGRRGDIGNCGLGIVDCGFLIDRETGRDLPGFGKPGRVCVGEGETMYSSGS